MTSDANNRVDPEKKVDEPQDPNDPNKEPKDPEGGNGEDPDFKEQPGETPEAKNARLERMLDRHQKKNKIGKYAEGADPNKPANSSDLDYGQKAFLIASGIKTSDEQALVQQIMKDTGKSLEAVVESKYFQAELKEIRDAQATRDAIPSGTKRSGAGSRDSVEYWLAKGELPPASETKLRREVVNARMKNESSGSPFTKNPVVGN